jgi:hypothetical protein
MDPEGGRLWTICGECRRWSLHDPESRGESIARLERLVRDRGVEVARTARVSLWEAGRLEVLRVGGAGALEHAWWRYGREFRRRRGAVEGPLARASAVTLGAMAVLGAGLGLVPHALPLRVGELEVEEIQRWRRFGWTAWSGRLPCPHCGSIRRSLRFETSWWVYPVAGIDGTLALGIPCSRCDHWTAPEAPRLEGTEAAEVLRRVLAWQNAKGAGEDVLREAVGRLEAAGDPGSFERSVARSGEGGTTLWRLGQGRSVALEMAVTEALESRISQGRLRLMEFVWRHEEALASIQDGL